MIEKFTEDMFNLHYFSIHRKCALYELFKIIYRGWGGNMDTQTFLTTTEKNIYLSDISSYLISCENFIKLLLEAIRFIIS